MQLLKRFRYGKSNWGLKDKKIIRSLLIVKIVLNGAKEYTLIGLKNIKRV